MASDWLLQIGVGVGVAVFAVGALVWLARNGYFTPDTENQQSQAEREQLADETGRQEFSVPLRDRVKTLSGPAKLFVGAVTLLVLGLAFATYHILKTGSPYQQFITREVQMGLVALVGITGGVYLEKWFRDQVGHLYVLYESYSADDEVEKIPFKKSQVRRSGGSPIVPEVARNRLFGLFWRLRQVGEDRRLRETGKPLSDILEHKVPDHGAELPDGEGWLIETHEDGDEILGSVSALADVTYTSPHSLSDQRAAEIRQSRARLNAQLDAVKATNAELYRQIRYLQKKIENEEYYQREEFMSDLERIADQLEKFASPQGDGAAGSGGAASALEDGQEAEA